MWLMTNKEIKGQNIYINSPVHWKTNDKFTGEFA